jgi:peptidyl-prolyl cis-trans isomerase A (cyclophilin A)
MIDRFALFLAALVLPVLVSPASAMPVPPKPGGQQGKDTIVEGEMVRIALETEKGRIVLDLDQGKAPVTTANFLAYVDKGWLDGQPFYRAFKYGNGGIIQGGVRDGGKQLPPIRIEPTSETGLKNVAGTIAMANAGEKTTRSDFFIMTADVPAFDSGPGGPGFAAFGRVVEGMDVVGAILASPTSPTKGDGMMRGQMLEPVIRITKARRASP